MYKKYINPLKDVKQEKKPFCKIFSIEKLNFLLIKKPTKNDPIIEITKLLFIASLKKTAVFLRLAINNNFVISIIGSFLVGFFINRKLSFSIEKILQNGFFSCFTSFSGFIYFLYKILNQGDWIKFIIFFNLIIIINIFTMYFGFWISRKIT